MTRRWQMSLAGVAVIGLLLVILRVTMPFVVVSRTPVMEVVSGSDARTLVVAIHGFGGPESRDGLITLAKAAYPHAHLLAPLIMKGPLRMLSNQNPYDIADALESTIHEAFKTYRYERIVLIGHSMGGELLRKAFLWGAGQEDDRQTNHLGKHSWTDHVERFVSLASINRGWSVDPRPTNRGVWRQIEFRFGTLIAKLTGTGHLMLALQRGAPFIADLRVQWIRLARSKETRVHLPYVIHLLGKKDDVADLADVKDVQAAKDFKFKSVSDTDHSSLASAMTTELPKGRPATSRARDVLDAVTKPPNEFETDKPDPLVERLDIRRVLFILHGIRDYDYWGKQLEADMIDALGTGSSTTVLVPKYGHFAMMPFLLWGDRQENVRWFMDVYTETLAQYPLAEFDFIGHSNGTYILASALQRYRTLQVHDVYFAGSVVPQRYPWGELIRDGRVHRVRNVVATSDWIVAIFPRLYEQIAEWEHWSPVTGYFDIGAAGFRGFRYFGEPRDGVRDLTFAGGSHGTGVDIKNPDKLRALIRFAQYGLDPEQETIFATVFGNARAQSAALDIASNVSWLVWLLLITLVTSAGAFLWHLNRYAGLAYMVIVIGALFSF